MGIVNATITNNKPAKVGDTVRVRVRCRYSLLTKVDWFNLVQGFPIDREAAMYWEG